MWSGLAAASVALALLTCTPAQARSVGFEVVSVPQAGGPALPGAFWYPREAKPSKMQLGNFQQEVARNAQVIGDRLPLIVISHGALGSLSGNADLAVELARAGFVVIALSYNQFSPDGVLQTRNWTQGIHDAIDYALTRCPDRSRIDAGRIGAFGFSVGGLATLIAIGGTPDYRLVAPHCKLAPKDWSCRLAAKIDIMRTPSPQPSAWVRDKRIKAAVLAVPAMGYIFGRPGLLQVHVPVQLWEAGGDHVLAPAWNSEPIASDLPASPDVRFVPDADHDDFTAPCSRQAGQNLPAACPDAPGFDRAAFHRTFYPAVVSFFRRSLHVDQ